MNPQQVKEFQTVVASTAFKMDFNEFCNRTGFVGNYAQDKWREFQAINNALAKFDNETLSKILGG